MDITTIDKGEKGLAGVQAPAQTARKLPAAPSSQPQDASAVANTGKPAAGASVNLDAVRGLVENVKSLPGDGVNMALVSRIRNEIAQGTFVPDTGKTVDGLVSSTVELMKKSA